MVIISNLKNLREDKGKTQLQVSAETRIPIRTLQRYEKGDSIGDPEYLCRLMCYYGLKPNQLIDETM